jgi:hypothetical protein
MLTLVSCGGTPAQSTNRETVLLGPTGSINGIAALSGGFVFGILADGGLRFQVWTMGFDGKNLREVSLASDADSNCRLVNYLYPREIGNDTVAINRMCITDPATTGYASSVSVEAINLPTNKITQLSAAQHGKNPGPTTWNPDHTRGLAGTGDGSCNTLIWLTAAGVDPVHMTLQEGNRRWTLSDAFRGTCDDQGLAAWPAWSPDGKRVAFAGSLAAIGVHGLARSAHPWNIYAMDPVDLQPHVLVKDIKEPADLHWSHDGHKLAFSGTMLSGQTGTWITDLQGNITRISTDRAMYLTWLPTDDAIVVAIDVSGSQPTDRSELRIIHLS